MTKAELAYEETVDCVQCGYCLPACPTYLTMEKETHSPRGRINLVKMAAEGKITYSELEGPINLCLGCRACEVVCPTNVQYGTILESAKEVLRENQKRTSTFQAFIFENVLPNQTYMLAARASLSVYQQFGMQKIARATKALQWLPENVRSFESILPKTDKRTRRKKYSPEQEPIFKVGFFTGCVMDVMFSEINKKSIKLLQAAGCEVTVIKEQTCCGALQNHAGESNITKELARKNIAAFEKYDFDYIVNSIGGCGAMLVEYDRLFTDEEDWKKRAHEFVRKTVDISVILTQLKLPFQKEISKVVTYQPSCHLSNVQKRVEEPVNLLTSIPGIQYIPLPHKELCCGSAGIYNIVNYDASMQILDKKMGHVNQLTLRPEIMVATNPGCHLQLKLGVVREGLGEQMKVVHLVELLAEACALESDAKI
ncbi:(Fe-S)-binding protein [Oceanobacillus halophilus]|uniref:Glycolate oxidase iron-sulfur subunit n=1 Tax=Oceanobacillus halophilus TaxID=930130 RepID=A0A495A7P6_9BACI|nr:(Fe-S)-binding protein [Oceanobacillus halophilus]RKQ35812.1 (Fe-S)-binding protein [Oceanobacillus halophilus]